MSNRESTSGFKYFCVDIYVLLRNVYIELIDVNVHNPTCAFSFLYCIKEGCAEVYNFSNLDFMILFIWDFLRAIYEYVWLACFEFIFGLLVCVCVCVFLPQNQSDDGDVIDCVDINERPALNHLPDHDRQKVQVSPYSKNEKKILIFLYSWSRHEKI